MVKVEGNDRVKVNVAVNLEVVVDVDVKVDDGGRGCSAWPLFDTSSFTGSTSIRWPRRRRSSFAAL